MYGLLLVPASGGGSIVDLDATFFIQLGLFFVVFVLLYALLFRPVVRLIEARRAATEGRSRRAEEIGCEAEQLAAEVDSQIADARRAATAERDRMVEQARRHQREVDERAREQSRAEIARAREKMEREGGRVRTELEAEVESLAEKVAGRVLGRSL
ncbi:MAG: ATP synthase F0 subunit B [Polyangia bacterium]